MSPDQGSASNDSVAVVIPAHNAAQWIGQTLASVQNQTYRSLEIIVVDDGSTDATRDVIQAHAHADDRIRTIEQPNGGVARARNAGWRAATSQFVAFIDADDLWAPTKIECQLRELRSAPPGTGMVYSWYVMIDEKDRIIYKPKGERYIGDVLDQLILGNFVGNGSSVMVTRQALEAVGGFEPAMRDAGAQGCEDILFYCRVAERYAFSVVPNYQVGYRQLANAMSSDLERMLRSWMLVLDEIAKRHPDRSRVLSRGLFNYSRLLVRRALFTRRVSIIPSLFRLLVSYDPGVALRLAVLTVPRSLVQQFRSALLAARKNKLGKPAQEPSDRLEFTEVETSTQ